MVETENRACEIKKGRIVAQDWLREVRSDASQLIESTNSRSAKIYALGSRAPTPPARMAPWYLPTPGPAGVAPPL